MPLSVAAACSSKLKPRQKRLRSASPHALLSARQTAHAESAACPPPSSKKRSAMIVVFVGTAPSTARPVNDVARPAAAPPTRITPHSSSAIAAHAASCGSIPSRSCEFRSLGVSRRVRRSISSRSSATPSHSTAVRCGASPSQNGMLGGAPCASSTSTLPCGFDALNPPARIAQQDHITRSTSRPRSAHPASRSARPPAAASPRTDAVSGIAPPFEIAIMRAPRRAMQLAVARRSRSRYAP